MQKIIVLTFLVFTFLSYSCQQQAASLLVEAEGFNNKGGWVVDPQFVEQMGSPYLLAHGMGTPVENASTNVSFEETGTYHVWARTMDWAPGDWEAPGRFHLLINGERVGNELGTHPGWNWDYVGKVVIKDKNNTLALQDLTGFAGRCDAIYFSTRKKTPPKDAEQLATWRNDYHAKQTPEMETHNFDLVVVGGGIAGCAVAIAAAEQGLDVAIVHDRPVLGGNASAEIRVHTEGINWKYDRIVKMLNTVHWPNGSPDAKLDDEKRRRYMEQYDKITIFYNWRAFDAFTQDNTIQYVDARHTATNEQKRFYAPIFSDCTGDGWIGYWAGADYMYGREAKDEHNEGIPAYDESIFRAHFKGSFLEEKWSEYTDLWSPETADNRVMGSSVLWRSYVGDTLSSFPEVPWAMDVAGNHSGVNGEWYWEFTSDELHQIDDGEAIRDYLFKAIYGSFYNAKQEEEYSHHALEWVSYLLGKRESRRLVGDYIYSFQDVREDRRFEDAVVKENRNVDVHYQQSLIDSSLPDFVSDALYYRSQGYYIPYRAFYSRNINNLFMAGRNFSCTHIGLGGPRVMHTTAQMGAAVGYAASLCHAKEALPRDIYTDYIDELLALIEQSNTQGD